MLKNGFKRFLSLTLAVVMILSMLPASAITAHAASGNLTMTSEGLAAAYSGSGTWSGGGTAASGTVSGKNGAFSFLNSAQTATLTFTNGRDKTASLSFSYNITVNTSSVTIGGGTVTGSGTYEATLEAGDTVQVVIKSGKGASNTTAIDLTNISLVVDSSATTTFEVAENGTYTVNGTAITAQTQLTQSSTEAYTLVATPADGYDFLGWYSSLEGGYFSYSATASLNVENDTTVYPVFVSQSVAAFEVGLNRYTDFAQAITAAQNHSSKQLTLVHSGTIGAGEYTIPEGVKLLIPYDASHTASFGDETVCTMSYATPSLYSCLTLAEGAVINCYGDINVNAQQLASSANRTGSVTGPYGAIHLNAGAQLNMKSGANLYAYGYIGGEGLVWAESGSNLYQLFQIEDWRGGNDSASLLSSLKNNSFLFSQYYFQNIEASLRLDSGCTMYASAAIAAGLSTKSPNQTCAAIMGKDSGMFHMTSGYAMMHYDAGTDRMVLDFYGDLVTDAISMEMNLTGIISSSMNTQDYILGLPMNYTINIKSGSTVTFAQKFKLLPGTAITVEEGATATIASGGALYLYDVDDWNAGKYTYNKTMFQLPYVYSRKGAPAGRAVTENAVLRIDGTLTANGPVYSTKNTDNGGNAGVTGNGIFVNGAYGTTNLKEVDGGGTNVVTVTCVPVVGTVVGNEGHHSLALGTHKALNGSWYQHIVTLNGLTYVSGGVQDGSTVYVGGIKDAAVAVVLTTDQPCVTATNNATVTKNGDGSYTLSGIVGNVMVNATQHTPAVDSAVAPDCENTGLTEGTHCSACGEILTAQAEVPALGHTTEKLPAKDATCTESGLTEGEKCTVCGKITVEQTAIDALGHSTEVIPGYSATCTAEGLSDGKKCTVCGVITVEQEVIPATGHAYTSVITAPTCTEEGYTTHTCHCGDTYTDSPVAALGHEHSVLLEGTYQAPTCTEAGKEYDKQCTRCDDVATGAQIQATGHSHTQVVDGSAKAPTCTEDGKELDLKCANCEDVLSGAVIPATGHEEVTDHAKAPTCLETGLTEGKHCETCGEILVAQETVTALGHDYVSVVTNPTCTDQGYTTHTCSRCGDSYVDSYTDPIAENHNYDTVKTVSPTCTENGYEANVCSICGHMEQIEGTEKPAYGHTFNYGVATPTCTEGGSTTRTCEECGYSDVVDVVAPLGHDCVGTKVSPTCTEQGYTVHKCSRCDYTHIPADSYVSAYGHQFEYLVNNPTCLEGGYTLCVCMDCGAEYIPVDSYTEATGHHYESTVTSQATCTEPGVITYTCYCGESYVESIPATGHDMAEGVITEPTCHDKGYTTHSCKNCDYSYIDAEVDALGCVYGEWIVTKAPTCTEAGEKQKTCTLCGDVVTEEIPVTGHTYTSVVTPATCTEGGYATYTCVCGDTYVDNHTEPKGHAVVVDAAVAPSCDNTGLTEGSHCSVCGEVIVAQETVEATGHSYGEWVVTKVTSCIAEGEETRYCAVCGGSETRPIQKLAHIVATMPAVPARYDRTGLTEGSRCSTCGTVLVAQETVDQLVLDWEHFLIALEDLEKYAVEYAASNPGKDAMKLMINFIRTGIERYTTEEWITMAGAAETVFINEVLAKDDINGTIAYALRHIEHVSFMLPNGDDMGLDHIFGALNVSSKNNYGVNNTDFGAWVGDLCDLMYSANEKGFDAANFSDMEAMVAEVTEKYLGKGAGYGSHGFDESDIKADLDAFYIVSQITAGETSLDQIISGYYTAELSDVSRAAYFLNNRFPGSLTKEAVREAVFTTYSNNFLAQLLESGRELAALNELRQAVCYSYADYLYELAKDHLVAPETPDETPDEEEKTEIYKVFNSAVSTLAPGVTQNISYAVDANGKQMVFYMATVDITRDDLNIYANYANNDPSQGWAMSPVSQQMMAAQNKHSNPDDPDNYIPNYNVVVGQNANFYNMSTGKPIGLFAMEGVIYTIGNEANADTSTHNFFAILKDGTPVIADKGQFAAYKDQIQEAVAGGSILVRDGANVMDPADTNKMPRSCIGITGDGQLVMIVLDGRQEPFSAGATYYEMAQIMVDAGCVIALELDGGGSATFDAKQEGSDTISVVNRPCDTVERSVSSSLMVVSTALVSKEFDHAVVQTPTNYMTVGASFDVELTGVSASGNMAEIPEGAYLQTSDATIAAVQGNTVTALARGTVEIQLVVDGNVVGTKTVEVIRRPDALKFDADNINLVYGVAEELPLIATYNNSPVTITVNDVIFELSNETAGTMEGFSFIGNEESGVRNVTVTAKVRTDVNITASMSLRLFRSDESIFDFENATAGSESLAWNRDVANTFTTNDKVYYIVDKNGDVYAEYVFALDMKAIKAPARLQPLMEYLNGFAGNVGDDASPWDYLLALGNRVSPLTNVTITTVFPEGVEVDISDIQFVNDFMQVSDYVYNEETRTLTIACGWVKQTSEEGIDPSTANSIAILSGVKLILEKDALASGTVNVDVEGGVTYDIYLDTSQLHSFAKDPANQEKYGIYDYINPDNSDDAGGHFSDTYITFEDHFAVINEPLNGWVMGGQDNDLHYYYVNNEMMTGVVCAPDMEGSDNSYYYNFGDNGIAVGKYTGLFLDQSVNAYRYAQFGELQGGWVMINNEWYYFSTSNKNAYVGTHKLNGVKFDFEETGRLKSGVWAKDLGGTRYYYGPSYHLKGWYTIDGVEYCFDKGYLLTGIASIRTDKTQPYLYYDFGADGTSAKLLDGIHIIDGTLRYLENGVLTEKGLFKYNGDYYFSVYQGVLKTDGEYGTYKLGECDLPNARYLFDADGKLVLNAIVEQDGKLYYYENGKPTEKGLFQFKGDYYFSVYGGVLKTDGVYSTYKLGTCDLPNGQYSFGTDGKLILQGIVEKDGKLYYYENGKGVEKGLFKYNGDYYFSVYGGVLKTSGVYGTYTKVGCDLPNGQYEFGADGKMLQGIVEKDGKLYYYENGKGVEKGLFKYNGDYYFSVYGGVLKTSGVYTAYILEDCGIPKGQYEFDAEGKMVQGIVEKDGVLYYYENGKGVEKGLFQFNGNYYFAGYGGVLKTNGVYGVYATSCDLPKGQYEFDAEGKMLQGIVEKDGKLYYYENGKGVEKGLFEYNGDYYFSAYKGELKTNGTYNAYATSCDLPKGQYEFDAEGKMLQGIVEKNGVLYYYENGRGAEKNLFYYEGHYYFSVYGGKLVTNCNFRVYEGNGLLIEKVYTFNELGQIVG